MALAVSLHAPNDALRNELVPINRKHPIKELLEACWHYLDAQNGRSITFEYVMLDGVNDSPAQALELARLLRGRAAKVNLIPFNHFPGTRYRRSPPQAISRFRDLLNARGVIATTRRTRGDDIDAACGQLVGRVRDRTTVRLGKSSSALRWKHEHFSSPWSFCHACARGLYQHATTPIGSRRAQPQSPTEAATFNAQLAIEYMRQGNLAAAQRKDR